MVDTAATNDVLFDTESGLTLLTLARFFARPSAWLDRAKQSALLGDGAEQFLGKPFWSDMLDRQLSDVLAFGEFDIPPQGIVAEQRRQLNIALAPDDVIKDLTMKLAAAMYQAHIRQAILRQDRAFWTDLLGAGAFALGLRQAGALFAGLQAFGSDPLPDDPIATADVTLARWCAERSPLAGEIFDTRFDWKEKCARFGGSHPCADLEFSVGTDAQISRLVSLERL